MAPEVLVEGRVSKAADVYAFGVTVYELFTGSAPYHGELLVLSMGGVMFCCLSVCSPWRATVRDAPVVHGVSCLVVCLLTTTRFLLLSFIPVDDPSSHSCSGAVGVTRTALSLLKLKSTTAPHAYLC